MDNPGIWLVLWLLIAPIVALLFLSGLGRTEGYRNRDRTDYRPDVNRTNEYRSDVNPQQPYR
jgi:steroid 5-alpha reductase family enzyme